MSKCHEWMGSYINSVNYVLGSPIFSQISHSYFLLNFLKHLHNKILYTPTLYLSCIAIILNFATKNLQTFHCNFSREVVCGKHVHTKPPAHHPKTINKYRHFFLSQTTWGAHISFVTPTLHARFTITTLLIFHEKETCFLSEEAPLLCLQPVCLRIIFPEGVMFCSSRNYSYACTYAHAL